MATHLPTTSKPVNPMDAYAEWTATTAVYPGAGTGSAEAIAYCIVGLIAETLEYDYATMADERLSELGDMLYYCARQAVEQGVTLHRLWVERGEFGTAQRAGKAMRQAQGAALGALQKHMRGKKGIDLAHYGYELSGATLHYLWVMHRERVPAAMENNRKKLTGRLQNGQIIRAPGEAERVTPAKDNPAHG